MDALNPYPQYRVSRLPWLAKIPEHWGENRAKCYYREVDERSTSGEEELLSVSHVTGVTPRSQKNVTMFKAESYVGHKICRPGDLVINTMWAWMAALGVAKHTVSSEPVLRCLSVARRTRLRAWIRRRSLSGPRRIGPSTCAVLQAFAVRGCDSSREIPRYSNCLPAA